MISQASSFDFNKQVLVSSTETLPRGLHVGDSSLHHVSDDPALHSGKFWTGYSIYRHPTMLSIPSGVQRYFLNVHGWNAAFDSWGTNDDFFDRCVQQRASLISLEGVPVNLDLPPRYV